MCIAGGVSSSGHCDRVRIALATDWFAPRLGGIETQLAQLATHLSERGHDVHVLTTTPGASDGAAGPFRVRRLDVLRMPGAGVAISPRLPGKLMRELERGYDVVHSHVSVVSPLGYSAAAVARACGMPAVVTFHSVLRHKAHALRVASAVARLNESRVTWTAVSTAVARQAEAALSAPVSVLPNGTDLGFWRVASQSPRGFGSPRAVVLVSAGRLERKKRPLHLMRAFVDAQRRTHVDARLVLVGEGSARAAIHRLAAEVGDAVHHVDWQTPEQLRSLYASADGFVMASERESFGIAALEARAAGLPVIAMLSAGCSDFLTHGTDALLAADDRDLAAQLARFLVDADLRRRLRSARVDLQRYDWPAVIEEHERTYARAISSAGSASAAVPTA